MVQMCGCFREDAVRASQRKRSSASGSRETSSGRNLSATLRPKHDSSARYTTPIPPTPAFAAPGSGKQLNRFSRFVQYTPPKSGVQPPRIFNHSLIGQSFGQNRGKRYTTTGVTAPAGITVHTAENRHTSGSATRK